MALVASNCVYAFCLCSCLTRCWCWPGCDPSVRIRGKKRGGLKNRGGEWQPCRVSDGRSRFPVAFSWAWQGEISMSGEWLRGGCRESGSAANSMHGMLTRSCTVLRSRREAAQPIRRRHLTWKPEISYPRREHSLAGHGL